MESEAFSYRLCLEKIFVLLHHIQTDLITCGYNLARFKELKEFLESLDEGENYTLPSEVLWSLEDEGIKRLTGFTDELITATDSLININSLNVQDLEQATIEELGLEHSPAFEVPTKDDYNSWMDQIRIYLFVSMECIYYRICQLHFSVEEPDPSYCYNSRWFDENWEVMFGTKDQNIQLLIGIIQKNLLLDFPDEVSGKRDPSN